jgi:hypothetical protein
MGREPYRELRWGPLRVTAATDLPEPWVREVVERATGRGKKSLAVEPHETGEALVKVYRRRPRHGRWRRLRKSRAVREGEGYREFERRGIPSPRLLLYGERRRWGLWDFGVVATERVEVGTIDMVWPAGRDDGLLAAAAEVLAGIHGAGLAHGDPRLRNFLAARPRPLPFDLASWAPLTRSGHRRDLVRFLGSASLLTGDAGRVEELLARYAEDGPALPDSRGELLAAAADYAREKRAP